MVPSYDHLRSVHRIVSHNSIHAVFETHRPVCFNISNIFVWKTGSTASTDTPVPDCGIANTSTRSRSALLCQSEIPEIEISPITRIVNSSTNSPSMRPITSNGTPARPCFNI